MGRDAPPGSAGVPPAYSAVAFRSVSLRCSTPPVYRRERRGPGCAETNAGVPPAQYPPEPHQFLPRQSTGNDTVPESKSKGGFRLPALTLSPPPLTISPHSEKCPPMRNQITLAILLGALALAIAASPLQAETLESREDPSLDYPIEVLEADPYWQSAGKWALESPLTTLGAMRAIYRKLGTLPAQRLRLAGSQLALEADGASRPDGRRHHLRRLRPLPLPLHRRRPKLEGTEARQPCRRPAGPTGQHRRLRKQRPVHLSGPRSPGAAPHRPRVGEPHLPGGHLPIQRRRPDLASQRSFGYMPSRKPGATAITSSAWAEVSCWPTWMDTEDRGTRTSRNRAAW